MLASSLVNGIIKRGGTAELRKRDGIRPEYAASETAALYEVVGELNGYDVHAFCQAKWDDPEGSKRQTCGHFTVCHASKRGHHDYFSDYNPGGYTFVERIAWLDTFCPRPAEGANA